MEDAAFEPLLGVFGGHRMPNQNHNPDLPPKSRQCVMWRTVAAFLPFLSESGEKNRT